MVIPESFFIFISIFIIALYIALMIIGYNKGLLYELVSLAYTGLSLGLAYFAAPVLASLFPLIDMKNIAKDMAILVDLLNLNEILNIVAYFLIIFLLLKIVYIFISILVKSLNKIPVIGKVNKSFGALFGIINATIITLVITMLLSLPLFKNGNEVKEKTILKYVNSLSQDVLTFITSRISEKTIAEGINLDIEAYRIEFKKWLQSLQ